MSDVTYAERTTTARVKTLKWGRREPRGLWECAFLHLGEDKEDQYKLSILILQLILSIHTSDLIFCYVLKLLSSLYVPLLKGEPGIQGKKVKR